MCSPPSLLHTSSGSAEHFLSVLEHVQSFEIIKSKPYCNDFALMILSLLFYFGYLSVMGFICDIVYLMLEIFLENVIN